MLATQPVEPATQDRTGEPIPCSLDKVRVLPIGQPAAWLDADRQGDSVVLRPHRPLPRRCTIRPAALFHQDRGFPDVSTVMGRLVFPNGSTEAQVYRPFTRDPQRRLRELFFPVEAMPEDEWPPSASRWSNYQAIAKRLLAAADVPWPSQERLREEHIDFREECGPGQDDKHEPSGESESEEQPGNSLLLDTDGEHDREHGPERNKRASRYR